MTTFTIPERGNKITYNDIQNGIVRITVEFKKYFPGQDDELEIRFNQSVKHCNFNYREGRSHVIYVGKEFMDDLKMKPVNSLSVTILKRDKSYLIEKS